MAKKPSDQNDKPDPLELISRLLAMHLVKDVDADDAVAKLSGVGLDDKSVAEMLGVTDSVVRGVRFRRSKKPARRGRKKK